MMRDRLRWLGRPDDDAIVQAFGAGAPVAG